MSLQFFLLGWKASGLRCPDHQVDLCPPDSFTPYRVTLLQMPNGTGKTTTLNLLRWTLSGEAENFNTKQVRALRRSDSQNEKGKFIVYVAINEKKLTFELNLDFKRGKATYKTTYGSGIKEKFDPPPQLKKFLNPKFVDLFIFDGELAQNLLDPKQTRACEVIDILFQLPLIKKIEQQFLGNWETHALRTNSTTNKALTRRQNVLNGLKERRSFLVQERQDLHRKKAEIEIQIQRAEEDYQVAFNKDKNLGAELKELTVQVAEAEKDIKKEIKELISGIRDPQKLIKGLATDLLNLKENLDCLKLPTKTSKEFFEELAEAEECVCGREINHQIRQIIRERTHQYLGDNEVGVLNAIKSDITQYCSSPDTYHQELQKQLENLRKLIRIRYDLNTELCSVEQKRLQQGDSELEEKKKLLEALKKKIDQWTQRSQEIERLPHSQPRDNTDCLKELDILINQAEENVAEATNTLKLKHKTDIIRKILDQAHHKARERLRKLILEETNERIEQLMPRNPVFLEDIQDHLQLRGQEGASMGQTLSVSYAFLATLFNRTDHQLPFVVDSPAGPLDLDVRSKVARLIPKLCDQFVALTISSEREKFVDILSNEAKEQVQYLTIFRKTARMNVLWQNIASEQLIESVDGVMVKGIDFFNQFDLEEEV